MKKNMGVGELFFNLSYYYNNCRLAVLWTDG